MMLPVRECRTPVVGCALGGLHGRVTPAPPWPPVMVGVGFRSHPDCAKYLAALSLCQAWKDGLTKRKGCDERKESGCVRGKVFKRSGTLRLARRSGCGRGPRKVRRSRCELGPGARESPDIPVQAEAGGPEKLQPVLVRVEAGAMKVQ